MRQFFNLENPIILFLNRVADVVILSLLWFVFSLPMVTIGNATYAMCQTFRKAVLTEEGFIFRSYWDEFKRDLPKGILLSVVYEAFLVGVLAIILGGYTYYAAEPWIGAVYMFAAVLTFVWLGMMLYDFLILFGKKMKVKTHFGLSFVLCLQHLPITFVMVVSLGAAVIVSEIFPLFMLFLPAGFCWLMNKWLLKIENRHSDLLETLNA
jgi:uncharacterized membrane protein YesL